MSFRNRCQIAGAGGMINLSVPLEKGRDQKTLLKDVRISDRDNWQGQHWKTILSCYSRSPWFEFYRDELWVRYQKPFNFLLDWNLSCFEWSLEILQRPIPFSLTEKYHKKYEGRDWADWRGKILPGDRGKESAHNRGPGDPIQRRAEPKDPNQEVPGDDFQHPDNSPATPITANPIKYRQVFEERIGFLPNLSILDLLFCEGNNARLLLRQE